MHLAAMNDHTEIIKELLFAGANINAWDIDGWTPLMIASQYNNRNTVR